MRRGVLRLVAAAVLCAAVVIGVVALSGPESTREKLADWVNVDDCASVENQSWPANRFYAVPAGFAREAVERAAII